MSEHDEQAALFSWAALMEVRWPELRYYFAIPNGSHRHPAVAAKLKQEGVKAGVLDTFLPVPRGGYHGCWIELKYGRNKPQDNQQEWMGFLIRHGYRVHVCYSWTDASEKLSEYLELGNSQ